MLHRILLWSLFAFAAAPPVAAAELSAAHDLRADAERARRERAPLLLFYSSYGCPFCREMEEHYLKPLQADPAWAGKITIRVIHIDSERSLTGFNGERTDHGAFARARGVRFTPTLQFLGADGRELAPRMIGISTRDFFWGYLEESIAAAISRLRS